MTKPIKVAVTKGGGRVARALLPRVAAGEMFGPGRRVALSLVDDPGAVPSERAIAEALRGVESSVLDEVRAGSDVNRGLAGADWVVLLDDLRPKPADVTPWDWADREGFIGRGRAINAACPNARMLVAAFPSNIHAMIGRAHARDVPPGHWFALTRHVRDFAAEIVAEKAGVPESSLRLLPTYGCSGLPAFVDLWHAEVDGRPLPEEIARGAWARDGFEAALADRLRAFAEGRTPPDAIARAVATTIRCLTTPTPPYGWISVATESDGSYGVPRGLIFGFPVRTFDGVGHEIVHGLYLDAYGHRRVAENVAALEFEAVELDV